jgi:chromate transport protein ChrA
MVSLATGFLYASPRGKLWAIRNFYRNVWTPAQFEDAIAVTNLLPGPASTQLSIYCAWRVNGVAGALSAG